MENFQADIDTLLSHQTDNGCKLWTTSDKKLLKGAPFTTIESPLYLLDLKLPVTHPIFNDVSTLIFGCLKDGGHFKISPTGEISPCQVALALKSLCYLGHSHDEHLIKTLAYFVETQETDGGWKCNKYSFGRGEETNYSNPNTTLMVLDCMRFYEFPEKEAITSKAVQLLLEH